MRKWTCSIATDGKLVKAYLFLPSLASTVKVRCAYCSAVFRPDGGATETDHEHIKRKAIQGFLEDNPDDPLVYFSLGMLYLDANRYVEAIEAFEITVKLDSDYMAAVWQLANAYQENGDQQKAIDMYNQTMQLAQQADDSSMIDDVKERLELLES